nr:ABATE domain-containing protein [Kosakonia sp. MH5]
MDFINSEYGTGDERHDCFENDHCVQEWLETAGLVPQGTAAPPGLLAEARRLREAARAVVHAAMESVTADLTVISRILRDGKPETRLQWDEGIQRYRVDARSGTYRAGLLPTRW